MKQLFRLTFLFLFLLVLGSTPNRTFAAESKISDFESGNLGGWNSGNLAQGYNSQFALHLENNANDSTGASRALNAPILRNFSNLEFDLDLNGASLLDGDAAAVIFDQGGWKLAPIKNIVNNGVDGWQHIVLPLSNFPNLNTNQGIASMTFRFWNLSKCSYDIDNIKLTNTTTIPPTTPSKLSTPTNLSGTVNSSSRITLSWQGNTANYNIYRNGLRISSTGGLNFVDNNLSAGTQYTYLVKGTDGTNESDPSNQISLKTISNSETPAANSSIVANFEDKNGFDRGSLTAGFNSANALRLQNDSNSDASAKKIINSNLLKGYNNLEFDINVNGKSLLDGDASAVIFDQGGWHMVSIKNKIGNGFSGWQHVKISLSEFPGLNLNEGIASLTLRFWNYSPGSYDIDNIILTGSSSAPVENGITDPQNLVANYLSNKVALSWNSNEPTYIIFRNGQEIARTNQKNYEDNRVSIGQSYSYYVKAINGNKISNASNTVNLSIPNGQATTATNWAAKSIDSQVMSKYWANNDDNQIRSLVQADKALGAKQIAVSINFDNYALLKKWADIIHSEGLNVWYRGHWNDWDSWEKPEIKNGITAQEYLVRTKQFIISHPELFRAGDAFTMCVESENAAWWTGIDRGAFTGWESWRSFTRNQVIEANDAFNRIGLGGRVYTNWINMNGWVAWNVLDQNTVNVIGQLTLDHIIDWTDDTNTYVNALFKGNDNGFYGYDDYYNKWHVPMMAGEWGYSTFDQNIDPFHQKELASAVFSEFSKRNYIVGINYWIDIGHASRLYDSTNLLEYKRRPISDVLYQYYHI